MKKGFTLIEVIIFITLISLVFITSSYIIAASIRNSNTNIHKILATHYGEELLEWLKGEKETNWENFPKSGTYCFNDSSISSSWPIIGTCGNNYSLKGFYLREVAFSNGSSTKVDVNIKVDWQEPARIFSVPIKTVFTIWE